MCLASPCQGQNLSATVVNQWLLLENVKHHTFLHFQSYKSLRNHLVHYLKAVAMFCGVSTDVLPPAWICISGTHNYDKHKKTGQHLQYTLPLDDELLRRVKQVAMNNPFINNLQIRSDCLSPQRK